MRRRIKNIGTCLTSIISRISVWLLHLEIQMSTTVYQKGIVEVSGIEQAT